MWRGPLSEPERVLAKSVSLLRSAASKQPLMTAQDAGRNRGSFNPCSQCKSNAFGRPRRLVAGDFNGDGGVDLALLNRKPRASPYFRATAMVLSLRRRFWRSFPPLAVIDFNGDGIPDLIVQMDNGVSVTLGAQAPSSSTPAVIRPPQIGETTSRRR